MCGRFIQKAKPEQIQSEFNVEISPDQSFEPRYNITPSQMIGAVRETEGARQYARLKWGLIPHWSKDDSFASKLVNARAETLAEKPSFREAYRKRRCLIPADGYYEWKATDHGKQPFYFHLKDRDLFGFAGLWEEWLDRDSGEVVETCAIITTEANRLVRPVHARMPVIIGPGDYEKWLDAGGKTDPAELDRMLSSEINEELESYAVSPSVNNPANDGPELIEKWKTV
ncbi:MAG: SOS response-associated peptidase [Pyrinomonadaceae bacterium]